MKNYVSNDVHLSNPLPMLLCSSRETDPETRAQDKINARVQGQSLKSEKSSRDGESPCEAQTIILMKPHRDMSSSQHHLYSHASFSEFHKQKMECLWSSTWSVSVLMQFWLNVSSSGSQRTRTPAAVDRYINLLLSVCLSGKVKRMTSIQIQ